MVLTASQMKDAVMAMAVNRYVSETSDVHVVLEHCNHKKQQLQSVRMLQVVHVMLTASVTKDTASWNVHSRYNSTYVPKGSDIVMEYCNHN